MEGKIQEKKSNPAPLVALIFFIFVWGFGIAGGLFIAALILFVFGARKYLGWFNK